MKTGMETIRKTAIFFILAFALASSWEGGVPSLHADTTVGDTEIYGVSNATIRPNVLIIFDTSGSMNSEVRSAVGYNPSVTYPVQEACGGGGNVACQSTEVYRWRGVEQVWQSHTTVAAVQSNCSTAYNQLSAQGTYTGRLATNGRCRTSSGIFATGNYINFLVTASTTTYNPSASYPQKNVCGATQTSPCVDSTVYDQNYVSYSTMTQVQSQCDVAYTELSTTGSYGGRLDTSGTCPATGPSGTYYTGHYINYLHSAPSPTTPKLTIAKNVITELLRSTSGVDFGVMVFNRSQGGHLLSYGGNTGISGMDDDTDADGITNRDELIAAVNDVVADNWTPLAENLFEAGRYFQGGQTAFNGSFAYTSPIDYSCQKSYIIFMTDGMSTEDRDPVLRTICTSGDCDGDNREPGSYSYQGSDYLDDVAKYLYDTDLRIDLDGTQNLTTFTIGFGLTTGGDQATTLLQDAAANGHGSYYSAYDTQGLSQAFTEILGIIIQDNTSFVAPVIPLNPENRTFSGNDLYLGFFKPSTGAFWSGNVKRYGLDMDLATVVDKNGTDALDSNGNFLESSISYWSSAADGGLIDAGGVGGILLSRSAARNLYTYLGTNAALTNGANAFTTTNANITATTLDAVDAAAKDQVVNFIHGYDAYGADPTVKREWILGDILHSRPLIVHYSSTRTVIFVGSNDGMLHAFENSNGEELWGFVPPDMLKYLKNLTSGTAHPYFVDGSPKAFIKDANNNGTISAGEGDQIILIFGERRGGRAIQSPTCGDGTGVQRGSYYALDVTNPDSPTFLWRIGPPLLDLDADLTDVDVGSVVFPCEMGETWSDPVIGRVKLAGVDRYVMFVGGGYDETSQDLIPPPADSKGRAFFVFDVFTGQKLYEYSKSTSVDLDVGNDRDDMIYSIPSAVTPADSDGNRYIDRVYVGDMGGRIWRFDVGGSSDTSSWSGKIIFQSNAGADGSTGRKIFFPPDYVQEVDYDVLFFGTGDREHARNTTAAVDRLYAVKDDSHVVTPQTESGLKDVTEDLLQSLTVTAEQQSQILTDLANTDGWLIKLDQHAGEKVVSPAAVFAKVAYYTTYSPEGAGGDDPCQANRGTARVFAINYLTGEAVFNYDITNDSGYETVNNTRAKGGEGEVLERSDRYQEIGSGIPSGVVIIINETGEMALIGVGGGLDIPQIKSGQTAIRIYWRAK